MLAAIPFFIPEFAGQAFGYAHDKVTTTAINGGHKIGGKCRGNSQCTACKRDRLKGLVMKSRKELEDWDFDLGDILTILSGKPSKKPAIVEL